MLPGKRGYKKDIRDVTGTGSFTDTDDQVELPREHSHHDLEAEPWMKFDDESESLSEPTDWADNPIFQAVIIIISILVLVFAVFIRWYGLAIFCGMVIATSKIFWPKIRGR
jgi:hypothetical protein